MQELHALLLPATQAEREELLARASGAVYEQHGEEIRRYLEGKQPANQWRPDAYARAALEAIGFLEERDGEQDE
jgi:hypothetical protein